VRIRTATVILDTVEAYSDERMALLLSGACNF
jgi:hypothetical protein